MKILPEPALAALRSSNVVISAAAEFHFGTTYRLWAGTGELQIDGQTFTGTGARAFLVPISEDVTGAAAGIRLALSGLDPDVALTIEEEDYHQQPVVIRRLIFGPDRLTLLASPVFFRGRLDVVRFSEEIGGDSVLEFTIESGARDLDRRGLRIRSDSDQRLLGGSNDGGLKYIAIAGERTLYWGGRAPARAGSALGGSYYPGISLGFGFGGGGGGFVSNVVAE